MPAGRSGLAVRGETAWEAQPVSARFLARTKPPQGLVVLLGVDEGDKMVWVDLHSPRSAHVLVTGGEAPARSGLLRTSMISLSLRSAPSQVQIAGVDATGRELRVLEALPHALAPLAERPQEATELLAWLADESRRRLLRSYQRPEIVVFIDGVGEGLLQDARFAGRLEDVLRLGPLCGVHVVATSVGAATGIPWAARTCVVEAVPSAGPGRFGLRGSDGGRIMVRPMDLGVRDLDEAVRWIRGERGGHQRTRIGTQAV